MFLIDTNIFLELFLNQQKMSECRVFLKRVASGDVEGIITRFSVHSIEVILTKGSLIATFLRNISASSGLQVYETNNEDEAIVANIQEKIGLDFDDSLQYYVATKLGVDAIVSFDRDFDKLNLRRIEPHQITSQ